MFCRLAPSLGFPDIDTPQFLHLVGDRDPVWQLERFAELGFAGADDPFLMRRPPEEQSAIGSALERLGLELGSAVLSPGPAREPLWGRPGNDAAEEIDRGLDTAAEALKRAGGRCLTVITGRDPDVSVEEQRGVMVEHLRRVADRLERDDIVLCLEPTAEARIPNLLLNGLTSALEVAAAVDHPRVRLMFDLLHLQLAEGDLIQNLQRAAPFIGMVQIADNPGRLEPGSGEIHFANVLSALLKTGYDGLICLEHANSVAGAEGERLALDALLAIDREVERRITAR